jgi:hypothetical protein
MQRLLTELEKAEIVEREWAKARAKNPKVVMRVNVQDETDESGKPRVSVVIALTVDVKAIGPCRILLCANEMIE